MPLPLFEEEPATAGAGEEPAFRVNEAYERRLGNAGALATRQRMAAKLAGVKLPKHLVTSLHKAIKQAASFELMKVVREKRESEAAGTAGDVLNATADALKHHFSPPAAVAKLLKQYGLECNEPVVACAGELPMAQPGMTAAWQRVLEHKQTQEALRQTLVAAKRMAYASGIAQRNASTSVQASSTSVLGQKRAAARAEVAAALSGAGSPSKRRRVSEEAGLEDEADGGSDHTHTDDSSSSSSESRAAGSGVRLHRGRGEEPAPGVAADSDAGTHARAQHAAAGVAVSGTTTPPHPTPEGGVQRGAAAGDGASLQARRAEVRPKRAAKRIHGRGAGAGRKLEANGEPAFADKHPSWRAAMMQRARVNKAIIKSLRAAPPTAPASVAVPAAVTPARHALPPPPLSVGGVQPCGTSTLFE